MIKYEKAVVFALQAHSGQFRKISKEPYILHPLAVSELILKWLPEHPDIETLRICSVLHDVIEDTWVTYEVIKDKFGEKIANIVNELSKDVENGKTKDECEENYKNVLCEASRVSKLIKLADIWCNFEDTLYVPGWMNFYLNSLRILNNLELKDSKYSEFFENKRNILIQKAEKYISKFS
ncbi:HD domain-containing protein [Candidatus Woesearchaeota archaeon]|nr:HD domain-containing protein [Candidatus Woesearchaeota archaeon]